MLSEPLQKRHRKPFGGGFPFMIIQLSCNVKEKFSGGFKHIMQSAMLNSFCVSAAALCRDHYASSFFSTRQRTLSWHCFDYGVIVSATTLFFLSLGQLRVKNSVVFFTAQKKGKLLFSGLFEAGKEHDNMNIKTCF